eukprot:403343204
MNSKKNTSSPSKSTRNPLKDEEFFRSTSPRNLRDDLDSPKSLLQSRMKRIQDHDNDEPLSPTIQNNLLRDLEASQYDQADERKSMDMRDQYFVQFKAQQREYLNAKLQIKGRLESLQREYNFISRLDKDDVNYILQRKREQAALFIQRAFKRHRMTKQQKMAEELKLAGNITDPATEEEIRLINQRKAELENLRKRIKERRQDKFYTEIDKERRAELAEKVSQKKRLYIHNEMLKKDCEAIDTQFETDFSDYMGKYMYLEKHRVRAIDKLQEIDVMSDYLQNKENCELSKIVVWSQIANNYTQDDVNRVRKEHLAKLDRYRKRKDWEAWIEEDELDIEGERILHEIKNYKAEYFYNIDF